MLKVQGGQSFSKQREAIQVALLSGFYCEQTTFPIASTEVGEAAPSLQELAAKQKVDGEGVQVPENYQAVNEYTDKMMIFDWREETGLEKLFSIGPFIKDQNNDLLPDELTVKMILPEKCDASFVTAASNLAFRLGMETTAISDWLLVENYQGGPAILFVKRKVLKFGSKTSW